MKKIMGLLVALTMSLMPLAHADAIDAANIKVRITGAVKDNRYFLCIPGIGCLSILAAEHGKVYPILHSFDMNTLFVTNLQNFQVFSQGLPKSCDVTVNTNQTITISGSLVQGPQNFVAVRNLHCSLS